MPIIIKWCPYCHRIYESGSTTEYLGVPYVVCERCGNVVINKGCTEWELKNPFQKTGYILISTYSALLYSFFPVLALGILNEYVLKLDLAVREYILFWIPCAAVLLILYAKNVFRRIQESKQRMQNPKYREYLKVLGLLRE